MTTEKEAFDVYTKPIKDSKGTEWIGIKYLYLDYWLAVKPGDKEPCPVYVVKMDRGQS